METFYRTHKYLVEHLQPHVRRQLMDEIDWNNRLIGIKGSRGVGKTTFLLQYAKEKFGTSRSCLYINLNQLYFTTHTLVEFAEDFCKRGGKTLLIDQVFKYPEWSKELRAIYDKCIDLHIVFSGSSVMRLKEENPDLFDVVKSYNLRGFSFREYLNLMAGTDFPLYSLDDLLKNHEKIEVEILSKVKPLDYFQDYIHHGFYPFFLEKRNFSENLLKTMNMMIEVDVLLIKQIDLKYLAKIRKLLYLLGLDAPCTPNVSHLSTEIEISRATVMNYIKYLKDARLIDLLYPVGDCFPKKPSRIYLHNTNLMYVLQDKIKINRQALCETFFHNTTHRDNKLNQGKKNTQFILNENKTFQICSGKLSGKNNPGIIYAMDKIDTGCDNVIPLWLFGFLY
ncbi:MAG: AAA family ATPase [Bacteroidales bacterium]|nr:AAA family ATPase [Bacteroidales bacterium]